MITQSALDGGVKMKEYEKKQMSEKQDNNLIEEVDPDYVTGGAAVVTPESTEGLVQRSHTEECNCGEFSPNYGGKCGAHICENCVHAKKTSDDADTAFCEKQFITIS